jgi:cell cycle sensor histidine kinase DivJ
MSLIHPVAEASREAKARHLWFVATRLVPGAAALASVPLLLAVNGAVDPVSSIAVALLAGQAALAVICARTGRLERAYAGSLIGLAVLVGFLAVSGAPGGNAALGLLPILIVEAALVAGRREFALAVGLGLGVPVLLGVVQSFSWQGPGTTGLLFALEHGLLAVTAFGLGSLALREIRQRQARERQVAIQDDIISRGFGDLVTRHDRQGHVLFAGPTAAAALGVSSETILGRGLFDLVHVADRPVFLKALSDTALGGGMAQAQVRLRRDDAAAAGRQGAPAFRWFDLRVQLVSASDGEGEEVVCVLRDVTEQRHHQDEIERARSQAVSAKDRKSVV